MRRGQRHSDRTRQIRHGTGRLNQCEGGFGSSSLRGLSRTVLRASANAATCEQTRLSVRSVFAPTSAHPQITITFQPASCQAVSLRRSRLTFFDHFSIQKAIFVFGMVDALQPCLCQKHPRTSMIVFALGITMSGRPRKRLSHTLNRHPSANSRLRTRISGRVSLPRIMLMQRCRCSVVIVSIAVRYYTISATRRAEARRRGALMLWLITPPPPRSHYSQPSSAAGPSGKAFPGGPFYPDTRPAEQSDSLPYSD